MDFLFFDSISQACKSTARWRRKQAIRFPKDRRNAAAADQLEVLAEYQFGQVDSSAWKQLKPYFDRPEFSEAVSDATRSVGFRSAPGGINELIAAITRNCEAAVANG